MMLEEESQYGRSTSSGSGRRPVRVTTTSSRRFLGFSSSQCAAVPQAFWTSYDTPEAPAFGIQLTVRLGTPNFLTARLTRGPYALISRPAALPHGCDAR